MEWAVSVSNLEALSIMWSKILISQRVMDVEGPLIGENGTQASVFTLL